MPYSHRQSRLAVAGVNPNMSKDERTAIGQREAAETTKVKKNKRNRAKQTAKHAAGNEARAKFKVHHSSR